MCYAFFIIGQCVFVIKIEIKGKGVIGVNHWDEKFDAHTNMYGLEANAYIRNVFKHPVTERHKVVMLAEGEGRNAIYLAKLGYDVTTYDFSKVGIQRQNMRAQKENVSIHAYFGDVTDPDIVSKAQFDYSINIFGHVPSAGKRAMFQNLIESLVVGGQAYFEFYAKGQLDYQTGGPKDVSMLYDVEEIERMLKSFSIRIHRLEQVEVERYEGNAHHGKALVIQGHIEKSKSFQSKCLDIL